MTYTRVSVINELSLHILDNKSLISSKYIVIFVYAVRQVGLGRIRLLCTPI